jgi:hypothetical protein
MKSERDFIERKITDQISKNKNNYYYMEEHNYKVEDVNSNAVEEMKEILNDGGTVTVTDSEGNTYTVASTDREGETYTVASTDTNTEIENAAESVERARQELMELISDPRIIQAYRKARGNAGRQHVSKTDKKKKKAKRRMSNNSKKH